MQIANTFSNLVFFFTSLYIPLYVVNLSTVIYLDETPLQSFFALKLSHTALILLMMPHKLAQKCDFVHDFANNDGC